MKGLLSLIISFLIPIAASAKIIDESYVITDKSFLNILKVRPELTIDHVHGDHFEVHGPTGLGLYLERIGAPFFEEKPIKGPNGYPTPEEIAGKLQDLAAAFPQTAQLFSIGKSSQGRDLWVVKISRPARTHINKPEFKYIANMHGDEIVGRELMVRLIEDLLKADGKDPWITKLIDDVDIYILPSMNPDGAAVARRANGRRVDLNRDFPDFSTSDNVNTPEGREPETQAVMRWQASRRFRLSANFHGGAEVVNYPWDTASNPHPELSVVKNLSLEYARRAPYIGASTAFRNGIVNGYEWYEVDGGMQDWSSYWHGDLQVTIELSRQKWPSYGQVDGYYLQNRDALINFIGRIRELPAPGFRRN